MKDYVAVGAIYFDEAPYLAEWIEFHLVVGVERFFLYDHDSTDDHVSVLRPYVKDGVVEVRRWPADVGQAKAYSDALTRHRDRCRWLAFIDVDEFLFATDDRPLSDELRDFETWPAVCVGRKEFTFSGHLTKPPGLVIESYDRVLPPRSGTTNSFKCVVDPARTSRCISAHSFVYETEVPPVDGDRTPVHRPYGPKSFPCTPLCLNHYAWKSAEEARAKAARVNAIGQQRNSTPSGFERRWEERDLQKTHRDELIQRYVPAVRAALDGRSIPSSP